MNNKICPLCNTDYPLDANYCDKDGTKLINSDEATRKCKICGREYTQNEEFCPIDGGQVGIYSLNSNLYPKADIGNRFLASLLDGFIGLILTIPSFIFFTIGFFKVLDHWSKEAGVKYWIIGAILYLIPITYYLVKDGIGIGQSIGKKALGLMTIHLPSKSPCSYGQSFTRNIISILLGFIPIVGWLIEPIMVLSTSDGRRLGDKISNTQVIQKKI